MAFPLDIASSAPLVVADEEQRLLDFRNATNLRSVRRADPSVSAILETSVYSTVYYYDEAGGKWEKQKQEGPLFVVQREKSPEFALYMLNRQTVKNAVIPLIPGEMKVTIVDQAMLQVARRGEKLRTAIWFSEGAEAVDRFRSAVLRICGEPSKRPDASGVASPAIPLASQSSAAQAEDGLSRLFAGLMKSPPVQSPTHSPHLQAAAPKISAPPPTIQSTTTTTRTTTTISGPPPQQALPQAPAPMQLQHVTAPPAVASAEPSFTTSPPPPALPAMSSGPPGQTADDLLMSILGFAAPTLPVQPSTNGPAQVQSQPNPGPAFTPQPGPFSFQPSPQPLIQQIQMQQPQFAQTPQQPFLSPPNGSMYPQTSRNKVGDATFAQAAGSPLSLPPASPMPAHLDNTSPAMSYPSHTSSPVNGFRGSAEPRAIVAETVIDGLERRERDEGITIAGIGLGAEQRKQEFVRRLTEMILTDGRFVDDLWIRYLDRMSRRSGQGG